MPSPKSGSAGSAVLPTEPKKAQEADKANPGEVEKIRVEQRQAQKGKYGSAQTKLKKPPPHQRGKSTRTKLEPVPGKPYRVTLPDGQTVAEGTLDEKGFAGVDGIEPGMCKVTFPNLEKQAWKPQ